MKCPFPGMDPYLERPAAWPDFHDNLIAYLREAIQPQIWPKYGAVTQNRLYVVESDRPIYPDVSIVEFGSSRGGSTATATAVADDPQVIEVKREEIRQPYLTIVDPAAGNRIVTAIEVLSPDNKRSGPGRESYLQKRDELWQSGVNCVEIDLLRSGMPTVRTAEIANGAAPTPYVVVVSRYHPPRHERYAFTLKDRLPRISLPLGYGDPDIVLDLGAAFTRCYETGPYPALLKYDEPLAEPLDEELSAWCHERLKATGLSRNE